MPATITPTAPTTTTAPTQTGNAAVDFTNLDPQVVALAKAIRTTESNNNYDAVGDNGQSHGAYQFNKGNFQHWATQFGLDPNDFSPVNQDKVAYAKIKTWKDEGYHAGEIAAMWNGAHMDSGHPVANNPDYITKVQKALSSEPDVTSGLNNLPQASATTANPAPTPQQPSLGQQAGKATGMVGRFIKGIGQGSEQALAGIGDAISNPIINALGGKGAAAQGNGALANLIGGGLNSPSVAQNFQPTDTAGKAGSIIGKDVLPAAGAVAAGGVGLGSAGVDVPGIMAKSGGVIGNLLKSRSVEMLRKGVAIKGVYDSVKNGKLDLPSFLEVLQEFL